MSIVKQSFENVPRWNKERSESVLPATQGFGKAGLASCGESSHQNSRTLQRLTMPVASRELHPPQANSRLGGKSTTMANEAKSSKARKVKIPIKLRQRLKKEAKLRSHTAGAALSAAKPAKASKQQKKHENKVFVAEPTICIRCLRVNPVVEVSSCPGSVHGKCSNCTSYSHCLHRQRCWSCCVSRTCAHHKVQSK